MEKLEDELNVTQIK